METQPKLLTVRTLIEDLADFDMDAEVCVTMHDIPITLPIGHMALANASNEDGTPKNYVIMIISPHAVQKALDYMAKQQESEASLLQLN